jgi:hypothetical protein
LAAHLATFSHLEKALACIPLKTMIIPSV